VSLEQGQRLGRYTVLEPIGAGGMGVVYRGQDTDLKRTVAIKTIAAPFASNPAAGPQFEREIRFGVDLEHPHICRLLDAGTVDGVPFLVMEHLNGETLARRLERGPLPVSEALRVAADVADALAYAHARGIVHRDLKPSNIFLTSTVARPKSSTFAPVADRKMLDGLRSRWTVPGA